MDATIDINNIELKVNDGKTKYAINCSILVDLNTLTLILKQYEKFNRLFDIKVLE